MPLDKNIFVTCYREKLSLASFSNLVDNLLCFHIIWCFSKSWLIIVCVHIFVEISFQPETMKQNAIIEKTALFISKHSAQMEIVIKTKQKNNPQFAFLEYNNELNPYYKHVVKMIKSAKYQPYSQRERQNSEFAYFYTDTMLI